MLGRISMDESDAATSVALIAKQEAKGMEILDRVIYRG